METQAHDIILSSGDRTLADSIIETFKEVERNFFFRSWKTSALDSGHFVESVRRFIDFRLTDAYTPIGKNLAAFNNVELARLEKLSGLEAYRLHIPRALFIIYGLRNKRGIGHLGLVSPNYLDATFIIATCKWVLAEILRSESALTYDETSAIVERIVDRPITGLWDIGSTRRILADGLKLRQKILFLLLAESPQPTERLLHSIGYKDAKYFNKLLRTLHDERCIELTNEGVCHLSPKGSVEAEQVALSSLNN
jgi:hypothetical protein